MIRLLLSFFRAYLAGVLLAAGFVVLVLWLGKAAPGENPLVTVIGIGIIAFILSRARQLVRAFQAGKKD